jgi:hypothetical protein
LVVVGDGFPLLGCGGLRNVERCRFERDGDVVNCLSSTFRHTLTHWVTVGGTTHALQVGELIFLDFLAPGHLRVLNVRHFFLLRVSWCSLSLLVPPLTFGTLRVAGIG